MVMERESFNVSIKASFSELIQAITPFQIFVIGAHRWIKSVFQKGRLPKNGGRSADPFTRSRIRSLGLIKPLSRPQQFVKEDPTLDPIISAAELNRTVRENYSACGRDDFRVQVEAMQQML